MKKNITIYILLFISTFFFFFNETYEAIFNLFHNEEQLYFGNYPAASEHEIVFIFITSSTCGYSNVAELPLIIENMKQHFNEKAYGSNINFTSLIIDTDVNIQDAKKHINKFGYFDEIVLGNGWSNLGTLRYIFDEHKGYPITPQVIISERTYQRIDSTSFINGIDNESVIFRISGLDNIKSWKTQGFSFSDLSSL